MDETTHHSRLHTPEQKEKIARVDQVLQTAINPKQTKKEQEEEAARLWPRSVSLHRFRLPKTRSFKLQEEEKFNFTHQTDHDAKVHATITTPLEAWIDKYREEYIKELPNKIDEAIRELESKNSEGAITHLKDLRANATILNNQRTSDIQSGLLQLTEKQKQHHLEAEQQKQRMIQYEKDKVANEKKRKLEESSSSSSSSSSLSSIQQKLNAPKRTVVLKNGSKLSSQPPPIPQTPIQSHRGQQQPNQEEYRQQVGQYAHLLSQPSDTKYHQSQPNPYTPNQGTNGHCRRTELKGI